ncbi:two-component system response regulator YesN [Sporomusaceae bacterium BoRhaA]|uniref:response regulator n=1 Tax=Pelorhabdus rhamnosifermentans TaxID=2772457 RepID=UPI001C0627FF|nr:response regulator [Pelorhabdus rhamnosifermentans]MBU2701418.1 two-component system response regulator YesN [Pelorhabdus rhamnosifermentans]
MWKILIADDEPKIRKGLKNLMVWSEMNMEVVAEAEDGEMALDLAQKLQPNILLVDICMPFLNGLQFIEQLHEVLNDCIVIVITGHDEFSYAQQAIKLQVFDYLLKPISRESLWQVLKKAEQKLLDLQSKESYLNWANRETKKNLPLLRQTFCKEWVKGQLAESYVAEQLNFLELAVPPIAGMFVMKVVGQWACGEFLQEENHEALQAELQVLAKEFFQGWLPNLIFSDDKHQLVVITPLNPLDEWEQLGVQWQAQVEKQLKQFVVVSQQSVSDGMMNIADVYHNLMLEVNQKVSYTPVVMLSQKYIEAHYDKENLSLQDLAASIQISPTYLSRLLKREIGLSFIDCLTHIRIKRAIQLMSNPTLKLYEVAERVGYSNQHYFSTAFKKVVGQSPAEYRKKR